MLDLIVVGSGPSGLSCAYWAKKLGLSYLVLEKGTITNSIYHYPISMIFFTTRELIEIGDYPLNIFNIKPSREEALRYYSRFVLDHQIRIHTYEEVQKIEKEKDDSFSVWTSQSSGNLNHLGSSNGSTATNKRRENENGTEKRYRSRSVVIATGVFGQPRMMEIVGEELEKVSHYYQESHPYVGKKVLIVGGSNSSAESALDLYRAGSEVTVCVRRDRFQHLKYWLEPDILNRIKEGSIQCYYESEVQEIRPKEVRVRLKDQSEILIENDFILALTGYQPDYTLLKSIGVQIVDGKPVHDPDSFQTNVEGLYIAGVITAGMDSSLVFIENGRFHGKKILSHLQSRGIKPSK